MKVYSLITERDGETTKEPGLATTEIKRIERLYAATEFREVWQFAVDFETDGETIISIAEVATAIHVIY